MFGVSSVKTSSILSVAKTLDLKATDIKGDYLITRHSDLGIAMLNVCGLSLTTKVEKTYKADIWYRTLVIYSDKNKVIINISTTL